MIVCGINSSAYVAEIIRSGIQAVDKGQTEAARSLGMSHAQTMRLVVIPQAFKIVIPALGNEFITLIKETAVLSAISITDITRRVCSGRPRNFTVAGVFGNGSSIHDADHTVVKDYGCIGKEDVARC